MKKFAVIIFTLVTIAATNAAVFTINADGTVTESGLQTVTLNLELLGPEISIDNNNFYFTAYGKTDVNVANQQLMITNTGYDTLNWQIEIPNDCNWLFADILNGHVASGDINIVTLSVDPNKADYGYNYCTLQVIDSNASNSPQEVEIRLSVYRPSIEISPPYGFSIYARKDKTATDIFTISNKGYDVLDWTIDTPSNYNWLISVDPNSGSCQHDENIEVTVTVDANGLDLGWQGEVSITVNSLQPTLPYSFQIGLYVYESNVIHVPHDYLTLQQAVAAAQYYGDIIIVHPGKYEGCDNYYKSLTIQSTDPNDPQIVASTIFGSPIICSGAGSGYIDRPYMNINGLSFIFDDNMEQSSRYCWAVSSNYYYTNIKNCIVKNWPDGGIRIISGHCGLTFEAFIENCLIYQNHSFGIRCRNSNSDSIPRITINNCTITDTIRVSYNEKYGIKIYPPISASITNSIIKNVTEPHDNEIYYENYLYDISDLSISNSCIPAGPNSIYISDLQYLNLTYGPGNIQSDPCFVRNGFIHDNNTPDDFEDDFCIEGDYHLKSQYGRWQWSPFVDMDPSTDGYLDWSDFAVLANDWSKSSVIKTTDYYSYFPYLRADLDNNSKVDYNDLMLFCDNYLTDYQYGQWVYDDVTSPCIDAGDPADERWKNELWPHGKRINMGYYGGTPQAGMSPSTDGNIANLNNDPADKVTLKDLAILLQKWLFDKPLMSEDLNRDGFVDFIDYAIFSNQLN